MNKNRICQGRDISPLPIREDVQMFASSLYLRQRLDPQPSAPAKIISFGAWTDQQWLDNRQTALCHVVQWDGQTLFYSLVDAWQGSMVLPAGAEICSSPLKYSTQFSNRYSDSVIIFHCFIKTILPWFLISGYIAYIYSVTSRSQHVYAISAWGNVIVLTQIKHKSTSQRKL